MKIHFSKYHGAGNDFIIIDNRTHCFTPSQELVSALCNRNLGIGADGLILLETREETLLMRYFNSDGNEATMCGNGGRCFARFAFTLGLTSKAILFNGIDGSHTALILDNHEVRLRMRNVEQIELIDDSYFIDTGSPHYISFVRDLKAVDVNREGRLIRQSVNIQNGGTNVNFVQILEEGILAIRTFERGVEAETLACGTGAVAAAIAYNELFELQSEQITLRAPGGTLQVAFSKTPEGFYRDIWLQGPVKHVFDGTFEPEQLTNAI